jgi:alpha-mannosidase
MHKKIVGYVVNHGHMDIEWYLPLRSYRFWTVEALDES